MEKGVGVLRTRDTSSGILVRFSVFYHQIRLSIRGYAFFRYLTVRIEFLQLLL